MFQRLDKLMPESVKRAGAEKTVRAAMILDAVAVVLSGQFGEGASGGMRAVKFKDGVATVRCGESAMTDEIRMREADIVAAVNDRLGQQVLRHVRAIG